jgi:hypothetical protein
MVMVMARGRPRRNEETAEGKSCMMDRLSTGATARLVIGGEVKLGELGPKPCNCHITTGGLLWRRGKWPLPADVIPPATLGRAISG